MPFVADDHSVTLTLGGSSSDSVRIAFHGSHVYSYMHRNVERLFLSSRSPITGPAAIRGGIPICWPCFGPPPPSQSLLKQHGFARTSRWSLHERLSGDAGDEARVSFRLDSSPATLASFASTFSLIYTVLLTPSSLQTTLLVEASVSNAANMEFTTALHSYFQLPAQTLPSQVRISPLDGLEYTDKVQGGSVAVEDRRRVIIDGPKGEIDRVYHHSPNELLIDFDNSPARIVVIKDALGDCVVWNPGAEKGATMGDMEEGGASSFVCLEPTQVSTPVSLAPGESWRGSATITCFDD